MILLNWCRSTYMVVFLAKGKTLPSIMYIDTVSNYNDKYTHAQSTNNTFVLFARESAMLPCYRCFYFGCCCCRSPSNVIATCRCCGRSWFTTNNCAVIAVSAAQKVYEYELQIYFSNCLHAYCILFEL